MNADDSPPPEEAMALASLEAFILRNPELDRLEGLLGQFNVFETLNAATAEIRHSNVLAWLLNPNGNHGLGAYFARQFLKHLVSTNGQTLGAGMSVFDFEFLEYGDVEVRREWNNIDVLMILSEEDGPVVLTIENKVKSAEHGDQLQRYRTIVEREFSDARRIFVFLTPESAIPSDDQWIPFDYGTISELLQQLLADRRDSMNPSVAGFIAQYDAILRRHIVGNSELEQICRNIYKKHQAALDLIFQYKPDMELEVSERVAALLRASSEVVVESTGKTVLRFTLPIFDELVEKVGEGWTGSKRILLFEFENYRQILRLRLYIGPGDQAYRSHLRELFAGNGKLFQMAGRKLSTKWHCVFKRDFLRASDFEDATIDDLAGKIEGKWQSFIGEDLPKIRSYFQEHWQQP